jgi:SAM-dependent methyltransferase
MRLDDLTGIIDFVFAFAVMHEMPAPGPFFNEAADARKPGAALLLVEPAGHINDQEFAGELAAAAQAGLTVVDHPSVQGSHAALLRKPDNRASPLSIQPQGTTIGPNFNQGTS